MREIRFRAWNVKAKKMTDSFDLGDYAMDQDGEYGEGKYPNFVNPDPACAILMQYTGLKDKNGKKIYEGDIIKPLGNNPRCWEVRWSDYFMGFEIGIHGNPLYKNWSSTFEIIGNIHENPELL